MPDALGRFVKGEPSPRKGKRGGTSWNKGLPAPWSVATWTGRKHSAETRKKIGEHSAQKGKRGANWRGGETRNQGYVYTWKPGHPRADRTGYVKRADLVLEDKLGRPLQSKELAHHMNHIRDDDRPENLLLVENQREHNRVHAQERAAH